MYQTYPLIELNSKTTYNLEFYGSIQQKICYIYICIILSHVICKLNKNVPLFDGIPRKGKQSRQSTLLLCKCAELIYHCPQAYESTGVKFIFYDFQTHKIGGNSN